MKVIVIKGVPIDRFDMHAAITDTATIVVMALFVVALAYRIYMAKNKSKSDGSNRRDAREFCSMICTILFMTALAMGVYAATQNANTTKRIEQAYGVSDIRFVNSRDRYISNNWIPVTFRNREGIDKTGIIKVENGYCRLYISDMKLSEYK